MKAINLSIFICTITTIILSCNRDKLPEPTQEGNNTFGMQVDGVNWLPNNHFYILGTQKPTADIFIKKGLLRIYVLHSEKNELFEVYVDNVKSTGKYLFTPVSEIGQLFIDSSTTGYIYQCDDSTRFERFSNCKSSFRLLDSLNSEIVVTKFDTLRSILSGTFRMSLTNNKNEKLEITNGRFDLSMNKF